MLPAVCSLKVQTLILHSFSLDDDHEDAVVTDWRENPTPIVKALRESCASCIGLRVPELDPDILEMPSAAGCKSSDPAPTNARPSRASAYWPLHRFAAAICLS
ncbi:unnamed protein product [Effrenium voratum]|nr:unnamed protein product [Effrenium voratum]